VAAIWRLYNRYSSVTSRRLLEGHMLTTGKGMYSRFIPLKCMLVHVIQKPGFSRLLPAPADTCPFT
jgi:hypothetical protein